MGLFDVGGKFKPRNVAGVTSAQEARALTRIERTDAVVRCIRILPQDTAEWQDREKARRARQTPPRPGVKVLAAMNAMKA